MTYFRMCSYKREIVHVALAKLFQVWSLGAGEEELAALTIYLETGEGENPFADVPMPEVSEEQLASMLTSQWRPHEKIAVYLYAGKFQKAMGVAIQMVFDGTRGLDEIARCFKAEDGHLARANRYIVFMKTGEGENPLQDYQVAQ